MRNQKGGMNSLNHSAYLKTVLHNLKDLLKFGHPQSYKNMIVIPLLLQKDEVEFMSIKEAEEQNIGCLLYTSPSPRD